MINSTDMIFGSESGTLDSIFRGIVCTNSSWQYRCFDAFSTMHAQASVPLDSGSLLEFFMKHELRFAKTNHQVENPTQYVFQGELLSFEICLEG